MKLDCVVLVACRRAAMYKVVHKMMQKHSGKSPIPVDAEKLQSVRTRPFCCCVASILLRRGFDDCNVGRSFVASWRSKRRRSGRRRGSWSSSSKAREPGLPHPACRSRSGLAAAKLRLGWPRRLRARRAWPRRRLGLRRRRARRRALAGDKKSALGPIPRWRIVRGIRQHIGTCSCVYRNLSPPTHYHVQT